MKIIRATFNPADAEDGTRVRFHLHDIVSDSEEERKLWMEMRKEASCEEVDDDGHKTTSYRPLIVEEPPLGKRVAVPRGPKPGGKEWFSLFTLQAADILFKGKVGEGSPEHISFEPIDSSPDASALGYGCSRGEMNRKPCVTLVSKDRQRALVIACHRHVVIETLLDLILGYASGSWDLAVFRTRGNSQLAKRWDLALEHAEILTVEVKTAQQALNALVRYRPYLDEVQIAQHVKASHADQD